MRLLYTIVRCRLCKFFIGLFPGTWRWQDCALMRSRALADGKMPAKCVPPASDGDKVLARCTPGRFAVARFRRGAFPGGNPWQVLRSMHPESGLGRENRQFAARFARHASENGLALARYARHASEMPRKSPLEDAPREDLARKGPFSPHGPLESCIVRRSCHPPPNSASDRNHGAALMGGGTGRGRLLVGRGDAAKGVCGVVGCRALTEKPASAKRRLRVSDADRLAESREPAFAGRVQGGAAARRRRSSGPAE